MITSETTPDRATRRNRGVMIEETRARLIAAARAAFLAHGYAGASMDELCAKAGLTRGALYHHFGGKEGLLEAVVRQIDAEVNVRLDEIYGRRTDDWSGFVDCCLAWLRMSLEPELQRIMLRDAAAVLGQRSREIDAESAVSATAECLDILIGQGVIHPVDTEALARQINGALLDSALWIASSQDPKATLARAEGALTMLLNGLRRG
jgi:AcrR family transcriptional regulator